MKNLIYLFAILIFCSVYSAAFGYMPEDTLKGRIEGTFTDVGKGHKIFVGKGELGKFGTFTGEMDYFFEYTTQYSGKAVPGSILNYIFSDKNELHIEITGGDWYVDFVPNPPEVIFDVRARIIGGKGIFKNAAGEANGTGTQLYIPSTPTVVDFTVYVKY